MFLGIDLTTSERKASACAALDDGGRVVLLEAAQTDGDILALAARLRPSLVAIDSPLGFPDGMCCLEEGCGCASRWPFRGRLCERELAGRGIGLYFTTKRSIIKPMVYRAVRLAHDLSARGCQVVEVYPYASKVCLFGGPVPSKTTRQGLDFLRQRLNGLVPGLEAWPGLGHDLCDALVAAYTALLHSRGLTEAVGMEAEGQIILPRRLD